MPHSTVFEAGESGLVLTNAVLLYRGGTSPGHHGTPREGAPAFATFHPVEHRDGQPTIGAGAPLTRAQLRRWVAALGRSAAPEILPDNVLVAHADMLAWWVPAAVRLSYFALTRPPAGLKELAARTVVPLPYPAHLFIATRAGLGVYALAESRRPTADTEVLFSPILNVFVEGHLCWGNIPKPKTLSVTAIAEYERAVFDSWSTHPNPGQELAVSGRGGLVRLWDDLAARKAIRFPVRRLKPFRHGVRRQHPQAAPAAAVTVGSLVAGSAAR